MIQDFPTMLAFLLYGGSTFCKMRFFLGGKQQKAFRVRIDANWIAAQGFCQEKQPGNKAERVSPGEFTK